MITTTQLLGPIDAAKILIVVRMVSITRDMIPHQLGEAGRLAECYQIR